MRQAGGQAKENSIATAEKFPTANTAQKTLNKIVAFKARTEAIARNLTDFLKKTDRYGKTIVFCVDQEHAEEMRKALNNLNADLVKKNPDYTARIVSDEGKIGRGHLDRFMELETLVPTIVTTSQMLTTGVDVQTCKNIVLARVINSMTDFKQIIGRGTRVRDDYGKLYFNILDYTGSATRMFADPDFDGEPALVTEEEMNDKGETVGEPEVITEEEGRADRRRGAAIRLTSPDGAERHAAQVLRGQRLRRNRGSSRL